jgi:hypothetical protein
MLSASLAPWAIVVAVGAVSAALGCGSRGPLDVEVVEQTSSDGGDASADASSDTGTGDATTDGADAAVEAGPIQCVECVAKNCGPALLQCATTPACAMALQCTVQKCLTSGMPNFVCIGQCAGGDAKTLGQLAGTLECVVMSCGSLCAGALGDAGI